MMISLKYQIRGQYFQVYRDVEPAVSSRTIWNPRVEKDMVESVHPAGMLKGSTSTSRFPATPAFIALSAVSLILWFHQLRNTMALARGDDRYTHILLILPIAAVLLYLQSKGQREQGSPSLGSGVLLLLALLLAASAKWQNPIVAEGARLTVSMFRSEGVV